MKELKPYIDANYKTDRGKLTFLAGASMGGLISAYAISEYPNIFGGAACLSTHWPALDGVFIEYLKIIYQALTIIRSILTLEQKALMQIMSPFNWK